MIAHVIAIAYLTKAPLLQDNSSLIPSVMKVWRRDPRVFFFFLMILWSSKINK